jgi:hypothetical protein
LGLVLCSAWVAHRTRLHAGWTVGAPARGPSAGPPSDVHKVTVQGPDGCRVSPCSQLQPSGRSGALLQSRVCVERKGPRAQTLWPTCHIQWLYLAAHGCKTYLNQCTPVHHHQEGARRVLGSCHSAGAGAGEPTVAGKKAALSPQTTIIICAAAAPCTSVHVSAATSLASRQEPGGQRLEYLLKSRASKIRNVVDETDREWLNARSQPRAPMQRPHTSTCSSHCLSLPHVPHGC